ncbi:MAG: 2-oxoglutarate dehydrogenase subunit [Bacteriovoracaceae bacterium]|nr:2-oxoglutarate dehydrogenase subunit [Bacteriovoracaceae bacterium]
MSSADTKTPSPSRLNFLNNVSPDYLENLQEQYAEDPKSIPPDWAFFFDVLQLGQAGRADSPSAAAKIRLEDSSIGDELKVLNLITAYRMRGHLAAKVDPLGLRKPPFNPFLDLAYFKLDKVPMDRVFQVAAELDLPPSSLKQIVEHLKETYCRSIGSEFHYIRDEKIHSWLKKRIDKNRNRTEFAVDEKIRILKHLFRASIFESFLHKNYTGQKRFSLEGAESLIPALKNVVDVCSNGGAEEIVIGMAHRGRLNVLGNVLKKPYQEIFKEFEGADLPDIEEAMGDVKYHQGFSADFTTIAGKKVHLSLAPNPSHLEFVNPVVEGMVRAKQEAKYNGDASKVVPIVIHGDAAVIGQGVVAETLNLSQLAGYRTGGTIHIVINNQIGFTTLPEDSRSSLYCTDLGKGFQCPIFHVNGDEVEDVVHVVKMAAEYRMTFNQDVFVDIYSYRKYGHNEGDEPKFTQPVMYEVISSHKSPLEIYREKLTADKGVDQNLIDQFSASVEKELEGNRAEIQNSKKVLQADTLQGLWHGYERSTEGKLTELTDTKVEPAHFDRIIEMIHQVPESFHPLPKFVKMLETRLERIKKHDQIDWAVGEQLAIGSLLLEGNGVRLSGQDSIRGTFSHRHSAMTDNQTSQRFFPLKHLSEIQGKFNVYDSPLSETGVLGFDYGYSLANPKNLVIWEAQFGDFGNGAQVIIDQFISSGETKWYRMSGITLLLPHGFEGQGPEHSSARLERYLQLCAQFNMQVAYPTTPAQYAHLLRRQMHRPFRKPLVVMTPKSLLRTPEVFSRRSDFTDGSFQNILVDHQKSGKEDRVLVCSGKIYWDLKRRAEEAKVLDKVAIIRLEQLYPLDKIYFKQIYQMLGHLPWTWVQEEPKNMGAWPFIRLTSLDLGVSLNYVGRPGAASPATGSASKHAKEQAQLINEALGLS